MSLVLAVGRAACVAQNPHRPRARKSGAEATTRRASPPMEATAIRAPRASLLGVALRPVGAGWREVLHVVRPQTVIRWHRQGFRAFWTWKSRRSRVGRPRVSSELAELVRTMALANPLWGSPRIHGELLKLGIRRFAALRCASLAAPPKATLADLANVPSEPHRRPRHRRLLGRVRWGSPGYELS